MKVRYGFVTNSSSSSFIIASRGAKVDERECLQNYPLYALSHPFASCAQKNAYDDEPMFDGDSINAYYYGLLANIRDMQSFSYGNSETTRGIIVKTTEELDKYYRENYYIEEDVSVEEGISPYLRETYQKVKNCIMSGGYALFKDVDYNDNTTENAIKILTERDKFFEVIRAE